MNEDYSRQDVTDLQKGKKKEASHSVDGPVRYRVSGLRMKQEYINFFLKEKKV